MESNDANYIREVDISSERILGLLGQIFEFLFPLLGMVLTLISLYGFNTKLGEDEPFTSYFISIVGVFVLSVMVVITGLISDLLGLVVLFIGVSVLLYFYVHTWKALYRITRIDAFDRASTLLIWSIVLLFIGVILSVIWEGFLPVLLIPILMLLAARIYLVLGFYRLPKKIQKRILRPPRPFNAEPEW